MGRKVMVLSKVYLVIALIIGCIGVFISLPGLGELGYIEYASIFGGSSYSLMEISGNEALSSIMTLIPSITLIFTGIISYILLGAFGELVEDTNESKEKLAEMKSSLHTIDMSLEEMKRHEIKLLAQIANNLESINRKTVEPEEKKEAAE